MSLLSELRNANGLADVAKLLGYKSNTLSYLLYVTPSGSRYKQFEIPKRSGGTRTIHAPNEKLKGLQQRLHNLITECVAEIGKSNEQKRHVAHGFAKNLSIFSNASPHSRRRYVFNIDLENFFPSLNFGRVRGFFIKDKNFLLKPNTATILAQIAIHNNELPQGSPCSPIISNLIAGILDTRLNQIAKAHGCRYTRYADDITFSTNIKEFPKPIAVISEETWFIGKKLEKEIKRAGYKINPKKTRMQTKTTQQSVTGLVVNKKPNIPSEYYRLTRSMCHSVFTTGIFSSPDKKRKVGEYGTAQSLRGILAYIQHIKDKTDYREPSDKKASPSGHTVLHRKFLNHLYFCTLNKPLVICEGKTDNTYLTCAIKKLFPAPSFYSEIADEKTQDKLRLFKYTKLTQDVMLLGGGAGDIKNLIGHYKKILETFSHKSMQHPVIIVIDNDDGAGQIFSIIKDIYKLNITHSSTAGFYRIHENLYLVKTTESTKSNYYSCIEDSFQPSTLATILGGKSFNPNQKPKETTTYGKYIFSEFIKKNSDSIDFSGFKHLLDRIESAINDYKPSS